MGGHKAGKHALVFIFITVLIDSMGLGIILPVLPKLIATLVHGGMDDAARYGAWLSFSFAGMMFLFSPLLGNLSDRFGRRPILILSLVGIGIDYSIMGWAPTIGWLFLGRLLSGFGAPVTQPPRPILPTSRRQKNERRISAWLARLSALALCLARPSAV